VKHRNRRRSKHKQKIDDTFWLLRFGRVSALKILQFERERASFVSHPLPREMGAPRRAGPTPLDVGDIIHSFGAQPHTKAD